MDFGKQEATWKKISKGILSPFMTKFKAYIESQKSSHREKEEPEPVPEKSPY